MDFVKKLASKLPQNWQTELKRIHFSRQIKRNRFDANEPEFRLLNSLVNKGDWVIDIGANIGQYTKRLSDLVSKEGRVIAFEPIPVTFSLLASNVQMFKHDNVTLINSAVSDKSSVANMSIPRFDSGLDNFYQASIIPNLDDALSVLTLSLDSLNIEHEVALVKIDVEGHEKFVLAGMQKLIEKFHPILIIEDNSEDLITEVTSFGYSFEKLPNSPNILFKYIKEN